MSPSPSGLSILWRGPLDSCNYDCAYCPFGKQKPTREEIAADRAAMAPFLEWVAGREHPTSVFFTPWGEGLIHRHYQDALATLSALPHVPKVAIQTNLSMDLGFLARCCAEKIGLWATFHPDWTSMKRFVAQVEAACDAGARVSAGVVGFPEYLPEIERMRSALPRSVYLWVNAVKRLADRYTDEELARFQAVDPWFHYNLRPHPSAGRACWTGERVISADGAGDVRRCHFVHEVLGNLYDPDFASLLRPRPCQKAECRCHIGYVHMPELGLYDAFGAGVLERAPEGWIAPPPQLVAGAAAPPAPRVESARSRLRWSRLGDAPDVEP